MNVLIITPILNTQVKGMERFVIEFSTELTKQGHKVTILTSKKGAPQNIKNVKIIRKFVFFPKYFNKFVKYLHLSLIAKSHLKRNKYDLVLAMGHSGVFLRNFVWRASGSPIPYIKKQKVGKKLSPISHFARRLDLFTQEILEKICVKKAKVHMFPSRKLKNLFEKTHRFESQKYFIPCSGVRNKKYNKKTPSLINWEKIKNKTKLLSVSGLSEKRKGKDVLLETLEKLDEDEYILIVAGGKKATIPKKFKSKILMIKNIPHDNMGEVYHNCDILLFPSIYEGFPNVILEAAAFGMAIIASKIEGIEEYFKEGKEIILIERGSTTELIKAIKKINNKNTMKSLGKNIKSKTKNLNYTLFVKKLLSFINDKKRSSENLLVLL